MKLQDIKRMISDNEVLEYHAQIFKNKNYRKNPIFDNNWIKDKRSEGIMVFQDASIRWKKDSYSAIVVYTDKEKTIEFKDSTAVNEIINTLNKWRTDV